MDFNYGEVNGKHSGAVGLVYQVTPCSKTDAMCFILVGIYVTDLLEVCISFLWIFFHMYEEDYIFTVSNLAITGLIHCKFLLSKFLLPPYE